MRTDSEALTSLVSTYSALGVPGGDQEPLAGWVLITGKGVPPDPTEVHHFQLPLSIFLRNLVLGGT